MPRSTSLLRTVGSISSATGLSRVLGLVRDQVQSYFFGAGAVTDAYWAAFRVPNLLRDLFAEGALSSAFVPTLTAERRRGGAEAAWLLVNRVLTALTVLVGPLCLGIALAAPAILEVYVAGFDPETRAMAVTMTRIMAPFLLFVALAAVAMGALNTFGRFFLPALAPSSFNVSSILCVVLLAPVLERAGYHPAWSLPVGAVMGGLLQFAVQLPALHAAGFRWNPQLALGDPALRRIGRLMLPATIGLAATQINLLVDTMLASRYVGAITWLVQGFRLMQLPLGLFGVAIGTATLARVSRDAAQDDMDNLRANLASALRAAALLTLPATAGLIALRTPIVALLFEHGRFTAHDTARTAAATACYALGLFAYSLTKTQVPTFYALGDTRTPLLASTAAIAAKIAANFGLIALAPALGFEPFLALALSTSLGAWINFAWLARALRLRTGPLEGQAVVATTLKLAALSLVMGLACGGVHAALVRATPGGGLAGEALRLGAAMACGFAVVAAGAVLLGVPEARRLWRRRRGAP